MSVLSFLSSPIKYLVALSVFLSPTLLAATRTWTPTESKVTFVAIGKPGFLRINGKGAGAQGAATWDNGKLSGTYLVNLKDFETGLSLRDRHMKETYLEVEKYPEATLILEPLPWSPESGSSEVPFQGKLKLHGQEQAVTGKAKLAIKGDELAVIAEFEVLLSAFKIAIPEYAGITVAEKVDIKVEWIGKKAANDTASNKVPSKTAR